MPVDPNIQAAAEAEVIGDLIHNRALFADGAGLTASHFATPINQKIFALLLSESQINDVLSLTLAIPGIDAAAVQAFQKATRQPTTFKRAVAFILRSWQRREVSKILVSACTDIDDNPDPIVAARRIAHQLDTLDAGHSISTTAQSAANRIRTRASDSRLPLSTGIKALDHVFHGGLHWGSLMAILARYKVGKTVAQATLAHNLSSQGVRTLMISLERRMDDAELFIMARCLHTTVAEITGPMTDEIQELLAIYAEASRPLWYVHKPGMTIDELRSVIISEVRLNNIQVVLVDHWQLIRAINPKQSQEQNQAEAAQMLADLAAELDKIIVLTGQLNSEGAPKGSEGLLASAAIAVRINRPDGSDGAFVDTLVSNRGPSRTAGSPADPKLYLDPNGPHFRDYVVN